MTMQQGPLVEGSIKIIVEQEGSLSEGTSSSTSQNIGGNDNALNKFIEQMNKMQNGLTNSLTQQAQITDSFIKTAQKFERALNSLSQKTLTSARSFDIKEAESKAGINVRRRESRAGIARQDSMNEAKIGETNARTGLLEARQEKERQNAEYITEKIVSQLQKTERALIESQAKVERDDRLANSRIRRDNRAARERERRDNEKHFLSQQKTAIQNNNLLTQGLVLDQKLISETEWAKDAEGRREQRERNQQFSADFADVKWMRGETQRDQEKERKRIRDMKAQYGEAETERILLYEKREKQLRNDKFNKQFDKDYGIGDFKDRNTKDIKDILDNLTKIFTVGVAFKNSKVANTILGTISTILGTMMDVFIMPFMPVLVPFIQALAKMVPKLSAFLTKFSEDPIGAIGMLLKGLFSKDFWKGVFGFISSGDIIKVLFGGAAAIGIGAAMLNAPMIMAKLFGAGTGILVSSIHGLFNMIFNRGVPSGNMFPGGLHGAGQYNTRGGGLFPRGLHAANTAMYASGGGLFPGGLHQQQQAPRRGGLASTMARSSSSMARSSGAIARGVGSIGRMSGSIVKMIPMLAGVVTGLGPLGLLVGALAGLGGLAYFLYRMKGNEKDKFNFPNATDVERSSNVFDADGNRKGTQGTIFSQETSEIYGMGSFGDTRVNRVDNTKSPAALASQIGDWLSMDWQTWVGAQQYVPKDLNPGMHRVGQYIGASGVSALIPQNTEAMLAISRYYEGEGINKFALKEEERQKELNNFSGKELIDLISGTGKYKGVAAWEALTHPIFFNAMAQKFNNNGIPDFRTIGLTAMDEQGQKSVHRQNIDLQNINTIGYENGIITRVTGINEAYKADTILFLRNIESILERFFGVDSSTEVFGNLGKTGGIRLSIENNSNEGKTIVNASGNPFSNLNQGDTDTQVGSIN